MSKQDTLDHTRDNLKRLLLDTINNQISHNLKNGMVWIKKMLLLLLVLQAIQTARYKCSLTQRKEELQPLQ